MRSHHPFDQSDVWSELNPRQRRRVLTALAVTPQAWLRFTLPTGTTFEKVQEFARRNLLRGFFERPSRVIIGVCARRADRSQIELRLGLAPHAVRVTLPAWGCGLNKALEIAFGGPVTPLGPAEDVPHGPT